MIFGTSAEHLFSVLSRDYPALCYKADESADESKKQALVKPLKSKIK
jgi:hypothetical protein